jgi:hypothetical protein
LGEDGVSGAINANSSRWRRFFGIRGFSDLPYGVTARNPWDVVIPFVDLWRAYTRIRLDFRPPRQAVFAPPARTCLPNTIWGECEMMKGMISLACLGVFLTATASAQTKLSGTLQCDKPNPQYSIPVADRAGHSMVIAQSKCTWSMPLEIEGSQTKDGSDSGYSDVDGTMSRDMGYHMSNMASGDQFIVRFTGATTLSNGIPKTQVGTWRFVQGTGKLKGITGKGSYKTAGNPDGTSITQIQGEYEIPKK